MGRGASRTNTQRAGAVVGEGACCCELREALTKRTNTGRPWSGRRCLRPSIAQLQCQLDIPCLLAKLANVHDELGCVSVPSGSEETHELPRALHRRPRECRARSPQAYPVQRASWLLLASEGILAHKSCRTRTVVSYSSAHAAHNVISPDGDIEQRPALLRGAAHVTIRRHEVVCTVSSTAAPYSPLLACWGRLSETAPETAAFKASSGRCWQLACGHASGGWLPCDCPCGFVYRFRIRGIVTASRSPPIAYDTPRYSSRSTAVSWSAQKSLRCREEGEREACSLAKWVRKGQGRKTHQVHQARVDRRASRIPWEEWRGSRQ